MINVYACSLCNQPRLGYLVFLARIHVYLALPYDARFVLVHVLGYRPLHKQRSVPSYPNQVGYLTSFYLPVSWLISVYPPDGNALLGNSLQQVLVIATKARDGIFSGRTACETRGSEA